MKCLAAGDRKNSSRRNGLIFILYCQRSDYVDRQTCFSVLYLDTDGIILFCLTYSIRQFVNIGFYDW